MFRCLLEVMASVITNTKKKTRTNCTSTFVPESLLPASFCPRVHVVFRSDVRLEKHFCEHYREGFRSLVSLGFSKALLSLLRALLQISSALL